MENQANRPEFLIKIFLAHFGEQWETECAPACLQSMEMFCQKVTDFIMEGFVAQDYPPTWPSRSIDIAWRIWHQTFEDSQKSMWAIFTLNNGDVMAEHSATDVKFLGEYHQLAEVLCRMFLCQAWYIATENKLGA